MMSRVIYIELIVQEEDCQELCAANPECGYYTWSVSAGGRKEINEKFHTAKDAQKFSALFSGERGTEDYSHMCNMIHVQS